MPHARLWRGPFLRARRARTDGRRSARRRAQRAASPTRRRNVVQQLLVAIDDDDCHDGYGVSVVPCLGYVPSPRRHQGGVSPETDGA